MNKVFITGTSRGIGLATAQKFLHEGWFVYGASTSDNIHLKHTNYKHHRVNLSDDISIQSCTNELKKQNIRIDVLINCAGVNFEPDENINKMDVSILRKVLEINLIGTITLTENLLSSIKPFGHIVAVSSMMASLNESDNGNCPAYRISKTALNMYIKTLAYRLKNITVSAFDPGWVRTDMGGSDAPRIADIPARELYGLVTVPHETGKFWFEGKIRSW